MRIFLRTLVFKLPVFLSPLINFIQSIISDNHPGNHDVLLIIIHGMCNPHKKVLPQMKHSKKIIPNNTFYIVNRNSGYGLNRIYIANTNPKKLYEN